MLIAKMMAADQTVDGVPPSLSAKVVGYVDSWYKHFAILLSNVDNCTDVSGRLPNACTCRV